MSVERNHNESIIFLRHLYCLFSSTFRVDMKSSSKIHIVLGLERNLCIRYNLLNLRILK